MGKNKKVEAAEVVDLVEETVQEEIQEESFEYTVKAGDGIKKIARTLKKDWEKIVEDNNLQEPYELNINQKLIIK